MIYDSESKRIYNPPELEFIFYNTEDVLTGSIPAGNGANTDHNYNGNGSGLSENDSDSDINFDLFDFDEIFNLN